MRSTRRSLQLVLLFGSLVLVAASVLAHPPFAPFDDTRFAPITRFGPAISVQLVAATNVDPNGPPDPNPLVAPNKGVTAPGLPGHLFIVDQPGKVWVVNFNTNDPATDLP